MLHSLSNAFAFTSSNHKVASVSSLDDKHIISNAFGAREFNPVANYLSDCTNKTLS